MNTKIATEPIDIVRAYYYRYDSFSFMTKATRDYQRSFGLKPIQANHMAIQLGTNVYEVSLEGTSCIKYDDTLLLHESLIAFYECDIKHISDDIKLAARFALDYDVFNNRKLRLSECMGYLKQWYLRRNKRSPFQFAMDFNLKPGTIVERRFNLPYTCASQAAHVFSRLFGLEPIVDSHLPTALLWMNLAMSDQGIGHMYEVIEQ